MSKSKVRHWCIDFKIGCTNVLDEIHSGWPNLVTEELLMKINEKTRENRRFTITDHSENFPSTSRLFGS